MTIKTNDSEAETPVERYNRVCRLAKTTPPDAPAPITYGDALFVLRYVAEDAAQPQERRDMARRERAALLRRMRQRRLAETGGQV